MCSTLFHDQHTPMRTYNRLFAGAMLMLAALAAPLSVQAQDMSDHHRVQRTVSVSGEGIVRVEPDQATVRFGVVTRSEDPETARQQNAEAAARAMNAVRDLGIEERKIRLEALRLQPWREYNPDARRWIEKGFEAVRQVVVEIDDLETLPTLVAEIIEQGANRLDGIQYDVQDRDAARNEALVAAVTNAREKAQLLTQTLGVTLGPVQTINEQSFDFPRPMMRLEQAEMAMAKDASAPEPDAYAAGEIEVRATVHVVFGLQ